jgi:RHS repeat-associated protein
VLVRSSLFATAVAVLSGITLYQPPATIRRPLSPRALVCPDPPDPSDFSVSVIPDGGTASWPQNTNTHKAVFTIQNTGNCNDTYTFTASSNGPITVVSLSMSSALIGRGLIKPDTVTYNVGSAGSGTLTLTASSGMAGDQGYYTVTVTPPPYQVAVTPDGNTTPNRLTNTAYAESFTVQNTGANQDTFALSCVGSSNITCGLISPAGPLSLAGLTGQQVVTVNYTTGTAGTGLLKLRAASTHSNDSGNYNVPILARAAAVRAELAERQQFWHTRTSQRFFVKNLQPQTATYNLSTVCSGTAATCSVAPTSLTLAFGESGIASVSDTALTPGAGVVMLRAIDASVSSLRDSGSLALTVDSAPKPVVSLVTTNPGTTVERDLCLKIAAGQNAAFECGDLRVIHALPTIRTLNKARVPTLLYNSAYAQPYLIFTAQVTVNTVPDSVEAILKVGGVEMTRARWAGSDWVAGGTRQIALGYAPPDTAPTGVYDYTFDVATIQPSGYYLTSTAGKFILVNRTKSAFGSGWWLAGLERLMLLPDSNKLWISGDGSARLYTAAGSNIWVASHLDRPDTLTRTGSRYSRKLPGRLIVGFNGVGLHDSTVNRLSHRTGFGYDTVSGIVRLRTISLPSQGGGQTYTLSYDGNNKLATVFAPGGRTATISVSAERVDSIRDADNRATKFSYDSPSSKRISGRTDRRGTVTNYRYDAAGKLWRVIVSSLNADSIRAGFRTRETVGLATATPKTAADTANVYTSFFGARQFARGVDSIGQETKFWLDRYGAPRRIVNALGHQTIVRREEGQYSALATELQVPNGFLTRARYDARGNVAASIAIAPFGPPPGRQPPQDAITRYHWYQKFDFVDSIVTPTGVITSLAYDTLNGNRLWQQLGPDPVRRVQFRYGNTLGLLSSTVLPNTPHDSIAYDGMGNVSLTLTPRLFDTKFLKDGFGRDTMVKVRLDTLIGTPTYQVTVTRYDTLDRDTLQISASPAWGGAAAETLYVRKRYNNAGQLDSLSRWSRPAVTSVRTITTRWKYDTAGRVIAEIAPDQRPDSMFYDAAGNDTLSLTRRRDTLRMSYDALNRLSRRVVPGYSYPTRSSAIVNDITGFMGTHLPHSYDAYVIPPDTQTFTYDSLGNISSARNGDARVKRTYYANGSLFTDTSWIRTVQGWDSTKHVYGLQHTYDLDGRQRVLDIPHQLGMYAQSWVFNNYDSQTGLLSSIGDLSDANYYFTYTPRGENASIQFPGPYLERFGYDADGRVAADTILNQMRTPNDTVRSNRFWYDAANRLLKRVDNPGMHDTLNLSYSGLGHVVATNLAQHAGLMQSCTFTTHTVNEVFSYDALGNRSHAQTAEGFDAGSSCGNSSNERFSAYDSTGRLMQDEIGGQFTTFWYDSAGNQTFSQSLVGPKVERASYYAADGRVRAIDYRTSYGQFAAWTRTFDEYRYDALGRRIWVRSHKTCNVGTFDPPFGGECSTSLLRRTVWDGDAILAELQMPGGDSTGDSQYWENDTAAVIRPWFQNNGDQDPSRYFGRVVYAHAGGIDHPVSITRYQYVHALDDNWQRLAQPRTIPRATIMPFWNTLGDAPLGAFTNGELEFCLTPITDCEAVLWPFKWAAYDRQRGPVSHNWEGSLLEGGRDKSGLDFRRNRLYEPQTGRFTQEDPIGLSGGLNLYGFASGDPVNFADPFGLCPPCLGLVDPALIFSHTAVVGVGVGRDVHIGYLDGSREIRSGGTRSWRNNNPGNMRNSTFSQGQGSIGTAGGFAIFRTSDAGHNALSNLLETDTYQSLTVGGAIARFAPSSENDTPAYQRAVTRATGTSPDTPMNGLNGDELKKVAGAIKTQEGWRAGTVRIERPQ